MLCIESYNITIRMFIYPYLFFLPFLTSSMEFMSAKFYILLTFLKNKKKLHKELPGRYHFSSMRGLKFLCLSYNNLSGQILQFLVQLDLHYWNISYNNFEGVLLEIGVFHNASRIFVDGNTQLSGGIHELKLPSLQIQEEKTRP